MDTLVIWNSFLEKIKEQVSSLSYETWFKDTKLVSLDNNTATVIVPMNLHKKHLKENYISLMEDIFNSITGTNFTFSFLLEEEYETETVVEDVDVGVPKYHREDANLKPNYTFESFIIGESNKFAYTAAMSVAEKPGKAYNPLFLYGKSGLGKTHLMHAIGNYIINNTNLKVLYVTSDDFVNDFIRVVRNKDKENFELINTFKAKYRNVDVLMIDDIQFLENAAATQQEFFHTFNELYNSNRQIIISSDRSVNDLKLLEDRLRTRFACGLTANIFPPDLKLSKDIIKKKVMYQESAKDIPEDVIDYIANSFSTDVRSLEGAITRVFAYSLMMGHGEITLDIAVDALKDQMIKSCNFKNDIHRIQMVVSDYFHIKVEDLKGKKRSKSIAFPRQIAIYLCRTLTNESFPRIGGYFGGRDHSTIMHSYDKISVDMKNNEQVKEIIKDIKKTLSN
ncbi:MAG: chromosomal replication initiator protein DnaA [Tenericutes bacterium]|nr:chromosomal replication initiator protein DnaA [Mycoplasmatota bacterium]